MKAIEITIKYSFGSKFQLESAINSLKIMLNAWASFYRGTHRLNKVETYVTYHFEGDENN